MPNETRRDYSIKVVSAVEAIRRRPAMYIGSMTDPLALNRLLQEAMCLALDDACCGACSRIDVTLRGDGSAAVADDGRGLSLKASADGRPEAEVLMTELFACRAMKADRRVGEATCGIGITVTNALSEWLEVTTMGCDGVRWHQRYVRGCPQGPFERLDADATWETGKIIAFKPDPIIFGSASFNTNALMAWLRASSLDLGSAAIHVTDERSGAAPHVR